MTRTEQIRKARHDVEMLQHRLDTVDSVLHGAEEVAIVGEKVRSRLPLVLMVVAGVILAGVGIGVLSRRRRHRRDDATSPRG